jgi:hypothetical protein
MMKKLVLIALLCLVATPAFAFDLGGYTGEIVIKFFDWTVGRTYSLDGNGVWQIDEAARSGLAGSTTDLQNSVYDTTPDGVADSWGILTVTSINKTNGDTLWSAWDPLDPNSVQEQITGIVYGYDDTRLTAFVDPNTGENKVAVLQEGGYLALWLDSGAGFSAFDNTQAIPGGLTVGVGPTPSISSDPWNATNGVPFILLEAVPGVSALYPNATRSETVDGLTVPFTGTGSGYFNVYEGWGNYDWVLNGNYNGAPGNPTADVYTIFNFGETGREHFDAMSSDPARGTVIPEPGSMLLLGIGLAGAALRRKKRG